jgi:hypothetical protein
VLRSAKSHPGNTRSSNGGRSFVVNHDGTVSPKLASHLVLGMSRPTLVFVNRSEPRACRFEFAESLTHVGKDPVPLTLRSHPGLAVVQLFSHPEVAYDVWHYIPLAIGPAAAAIHVRRKGQSLEVVSGSLSGGLVTPSHLKIHETNHLDIVAHMHNPEELTREAQKHGGSRPLSFVVNNDGTISPIAMGHLCLGLSHLSMAAAVTSPQAEPAVATATPIDHVPIVTGVQVSEGQVPSGLPVGSSSTTASSSGHPPLVEMVAHFKKELGLKGESIPDVVDGACAALGVSIKGSLMQKALACWQQLVLK